MRGHSSHTTHAIIAAISIVPRIVFVVVTLMVMEEMMIVVTTAIVVSPFTVIVYEGRL